MPFSSPNSQDVFYRIENKIFYTTEEVRYDIPTNLANASTYVGLSALGTSVNDASWVIVRTEFDGNQIPGRKQVAINISWTDRVAGPWQ